MEHTELLAADVLLERGVKFNLPAPLPLRMLGKKELFFTVRYLTLGTIIRISRLYLKTGITADQLESMDHENVHELVESNAAIFSRISAVAILNSYIWGKLLARPLSWYLMHKLTLSKLCTLSYLLVIMCRVQDFTTTIRLISSMRITEKNLSQNIQGSQEEPQAASIAPGE